MTTPRVLVTRAADQAGKLSDALRAAGLTPVEVPVLELVPPTDFAPLDAALRNFASFDWLILTSANAVRVLADRAQFLGIALADQKIKIAAVGSATASAIEALGLTVSLVPEKYVAEGLLESFKQRTLTGKKILLVRAAVARDVIPDALRSLGVHVTIAEAYRNQMPASAPAQLAAALAEQITFAAFTSSSSVTHLRDAALAASIPWPLANVRAISIGPVTTHTLINSGWPPAAEANPHDIPGLATAISAAIDK
jgi:uroporphyrinogen-III synthase